MPVELRLFIPRSLTREQTGGSWRQLAARFPLAMQAAAFGNAPASLIPRRGRAQSAARVWCDSYPQVARAVATGHCVGILPATAAAELAPDQFWTLPAGTPKASRSELAVAWNPRLVAIRPVVAKVVAALEVLFRDKAAKRGL
jgi:DNA-binding transcriptional LysR family regulator